MRVFAIYFHLTGNIALSLLAYGLSGSLVFYIQCFWHSRQNIHGRLGVVAAALNFLLAFNFGIGLAS